MLILTRRIGESLEIGAPGDKLLETVKVTVLGVKGNQVRIGVSAPHDIRVDREEIRRRIEAEVLATGGTVTRVSDLRLEL